MKTASVANNTSKKLAGGVDSPLFRLGEPYLLPGELMAASFPMDPKFNQYFPSRRQWYALLFITSY